MEQLEIKICLKKSLECQQPCSVNLAKSDDLGIIESYKSLFLEGGSL